MIHPRVIGILNITPDSFSDGGNYKNTNEAISKAEEMLRHGAFLIDIGGESTRPGAIAISSKEEQNRILPVIKSLTNNGIYKISVDTRNSSTAKKCIDLGISWINDISALRYDPKMIDVIKGIDRIVLMHTDSSIALMQKKPRYENIIEEIKFFLKNRVQFAVSNGIKLSQICIDPGIGFGKTLKHNLIILNNLSEFKEISPIFIGFSRKNFIGQITKILHPIERDYATIGAIFKAVKNNVSYIRTHNVKACIDALKIFNA